MSTGDDDIIIVGAGIGGLALALNLHQAGIPCRVFEAASEILPLGVGLNLLPHAMAQLGRLGLEEPLLAAGIETREYCYYSSLGQLVSSEPRGRFAGHASPQVSIHRADLHAILLAAVRDRLGHDAVALGHRCVDVTQDAAGAAAVFADGEAARGAAVIACDGIHSAARAKYHPEASLRYAGTNQFRGTSRWLPFLSGSTMIYMGTVETGKLVMYPMRDNIDSEGRQLINWVVEIRRPADQLLRDWNRPSKVEAFIGAFEHARFPWLDVAEVLRAADAVYEYPMVDQEPLTSWTAGRVTLLGDAAHPMMPRGSNGAAQAILDAVALTEHWLKADSPESALSAYEAQRLPASNDVVLANRTISPDAILELVEARTGGRPFDKITDVIAPEEFETWQNRYRQIAGFAKPDPKSRAAGG